jgi:Raf kinase inhibitor-like YbhB/YbcL family protein
MSGSAGMSSSTGGMTTGGSGGGAGMSAGGTGGAAGSKGGGAGAGGAAGSAAGSTSSGGVPAAGASGMGAAGSMSGSAGASAAGMAGAAGSTSGGTFTVTNPDFMNVTGCSETMQSVCDTFPAELASYMSGPNVSPELDWTGVPAGTQSFAVLLQDLVNGQAHWVIWNVPGTATMLAADIPKTSNMPATPEGSQQTNASFASGDGYFGPGSACNVYEYMVFALSMPKFTPSSTTDANAVRTALLALGSTELLGTTSIRARQAACSGTQTCNASNTCAN